MRLIVSRSPAAAASDSETTISFEVLAKLAAAPPAQKFSSCTLDCSHAFEASSGVLEMLLPLLSPGARLSLRVPAAAASDADTALLFAGFVNARASAAAPDQTCEIDAQKPNYEAGAAAPLPSSKTAAQPPARAAAAWKLSADDDLIDEDALLSGQDSSAVDTVKISNDDCDLVAGVRKACANCSCGRAEAEDASKPPPVAVDNSACGSCYLGDAFRCAGCPSRGLPPFKPGEKVTISL
jgi:anamorsin